MTSTSKPETPSEQTRQLDLRPPKIHVIKRGPSPVKSSLVSMLTQSLINVKEDKTQAIAMIEMDGNDFVITLGGNMSHLQMIGWLHCAIDRVRKQAMGE